MFELYQKILKVMTIDSDRPPENYWPSMVELTEAADRLVGSNQPGRWEFTSEVGADTLGLVIERGDIYEINASETSYDGFCPSAIVRISPEKVIGLTRIDTPTGMGEEREDPQSAGRVLSSLRYFLALQSRRGI